MICWQNILGAALICSPVVGFLVFFVKTEGIRALAFVVGFMVAILVFCIFVAYLLTYRCGVTL